jgi:glutamine synthetase
VTARPTRTWRWPSSWPRGWTASTAGWTRASRIARTCTSCGPGKSPRGIQALPPTLLHAADALVADEVMRQALGKTPDGDYVDYFASIKRQEFLAWHSIVTDWEVERYLTLF